MNIYKINETVHLKIEQEVEGVMEEGVVVFEYLGRGLNALRKLNVGDEFVRIEEDGKVKLTSGYMDDIDPVAQANDINEYREMMGRLIHIYGISDEHRDKFIDLLDDDYIDYHIKFWISDANIPIRDQNRINNTRDEKIISKLMDEYLKIPPTKEQEDEIIKGSNETTMRHGVITDDNGDEIPIIYFGDGTDRTKIHRYHFENGCLIIHPNPLSNGG